MSIESTPTSGLAGGPASSPDTNSTRTTPPGVALVVLTLAAAAGLFLPGLIFTAAAGLLWPPAYVGCVWAYVLRAAAQQMSAGVREVGALALGATGGGGIWVAMQVLGMLVGVVGFLSDDQFPYAGQWFGLSALVGAASGIAMWLLLRDTADRARRSSRTAA